MENERENGKCKQTIKSDDDYESATEDEECDKQMSSSIEPEIRKLRDRKSLKQTEFYGCPISFTAEALPLTFQDAMHSPDKQNWIEAMQDEIESLKKNKVWVSVENKKYQKVLQSRWVSTPMQPM